MKAKQWAAAFVAGFVFALGLGLSGMTQPAKVVGFLDLFGNWDPTLAFVMGGAVTVYAITYRLILRREKPILADSFRIPEKRDIDPRLLGGAVLFGIGWGLGGFCPGPGLTALGGGVGEATIFVGSMVAGMAGYEFMEKIKSRKATEQSWSEG